jgi:hypothetical protein
MFIPAKQLLGLEERTGNVAANHMLQSHLQLPLVLSECCWEVPILPLRSRRLEQDMLSLSQMVVFNSSKLFLGRITGQYSLYRPRKIQVRTVDFRRESTIYVKHP